MDKWKRDFPAEKIGRIDKLLHGYRGGRLRSQNRFFRTAVSVVVPVERQAQFVDTNMYYRVGGTNANKAKAQNDILAIQWGIGSRKVDTFEDQVAIAKDGNIPYISWAIFDPDDSLSVPGQAQKMMDDPHVVSNPFRIDLEKPRAYTRMINYSELRSVVEVLKVRSPFRVGCYSRVNLFEKIFPNGFPDWMEDVYQWIAQYILFYIDGKWQQTKYYERFLNDWEWSLPPSVVKSFLYRDPKWRKLVEAWQLSEKGNAEFYIANEYYAPGKPGIKSCDLNVSMKEATQFINDLFASETTPPLPGDCPEKCQEQIAEIKSDLIGLETTIKHSIEVLTEKVNLLGRTTNEKFDLVYDKTQKLGMEIVELKSRADGIGNIVHKHTSEIAQLSFKSHIHEPTEPPEENGWLEVNGTARRKWLVRSDD